MWEMYQKSNKQRRGYTPRSTGMRRLPQLSAPESIAITCLSLLLIALTLTFYITSWLALTLTVWALTAFFPRHYSKSELLPMEDLTLPPERSISESTTYSELPFISRQENFTLRRDANNQLTGQNWIRHQDASITTSEVCFGCGSGERYEN